MRIDSYLPWRSRRLTLTVLAVACLACWNFALLPVQAEAGTLEIPAWAFARGNVQIHTDPNEFADAGPLVVSGPEEPWGWRVEYDVDIPVEGKYSLEVCYAAGEARPVELFFDNRNNGKTCTRVTSAAASDGKASQTTWNSSGARWDSMDNQFGGALAVPLTKGKHTVMFIRRGPLPNLVALRLITEEEFPEDWQPAQYKPRDIESIPAAQRAAFDPPKNIDVAAMRQSVKIAGRSRAPGSLEIPAWTFDRGNVEIYADPDKYAGAGPVVGGGPESGEEVAVEYDIDFPVTGEYTLTVRYASAQGRPVNVLLDDKNLGEACAGVTFGSAPFEKPVRLSADSWEARKNRETLSKDGETVKMSVTQGKHTLKFTRRGPLPNLLDLRLDSMEAFPKEMEKARSQNAAHGPGSGRVSHRVHAARGR